MVLNGVNAALRASKDCGAKVMHRGPSEWTQVEEVVSHVALSTTSLSIHQGEALPFLYALGDHPGRDLVVHVAVLDKSHLSGFSEDSLGGKVAVLHSSTTQEAYYMALCGHLLASHGLGPVVHFIDSPRASFAEVFPLDLTSPGSVLFHPTSQDLGDNIQAVFTALAVSRASSSASYHAYEYFGSPQAERVVVATGTLAQMCMEWLRRMKRAGLHHTERFGVLYVRLSAPWHPAGFLAALPLSVRTVVVDSEMRAQVAASFYHNLTTHAIPTCVSATSMDKEEKAEEESLLETLGAASFGLAPTQEEQAFVVKSTSSLLAEVVVYSSRSTRNLLPMAALLGTGMGLKVQDYESQHGDKCYRKELRFSPLDISPLQFPITRADVLVLDSGTWLSLPEVLSHLGVGTVVVINTPDPSLRGLSSSVREVLGAAQCRVFALDLDAMLAKAASPPVNHWGFSSLALMAAALHFCAGVVSYAQCHVHLSALLEKTAVSAQQQQHKKNGEGSDMTHGLGEELSETKLVSSWLKSCAVDPPPSQRRISPPEVKPRPAFCPVDVAAHPSASLEPSSQQQQQQQQDDVVRLLGQLFGDTHEVHEAKGEESLEVRLGALLGRGGNGRTKKSRWVLNWASHRQPHPLLYQGIHHLLASREEGLIVALVCDPDAQDLARDVGLYAMSYGGAYVASTCVSANHAQAVRALSEASRYPGPGLVLLGADMSWPLYRWNPGASQPDAGGEPFALDSVALRADVQDFLQRDQHLALLAHRVPRLPFTLTSSKDATLVASAHALLHSSFSALAQGLAPAKSALGSQPLFILYGSDGGHASGLADTLARQAEASGVGEVRMGEANEVKLEELALEGGVVVVLVLATAGQGEDCANAKHFTAALYASKTRLPHLRFAVYGLGDSAYWGEGTGDSAKYFCLPAKRAQAKLTELGARPLISSGAGLGDDQHDDGPEGAWGDFLAALWAGLEVTPAVSGHQQGSAAHVTDDEIKIASNYLRGTIAQGLADTSTGKLVYEDTKLTKFHGIYQQDDREVREARDAAGQERAYSFMIRIGVPGGVGSAQSYLDMDTLCDKYASGRLKVTTRQAYQLHGVLKKNLKSTMQGINQACMDTLAACGDVNRNIIANPRGMHEGEVYRQVGDLARAINAHLKPLTTAYHEIWLDRKPVAGYKDVEPLYGPTYLPRKFKVAIAVPPENDVDVFAHCTGFIAIAQGDVLLGYNVCAGGGLGTTHGDKATFPRLSDVLGFCLPTQAVKVVEAIMVVQRDHGERLNRKHARLKYTVEDHGPVWYRAQVEAYCGFRLGEARPFHFDTNADAYGWRRGARTGLWSYTMFVENGYIHDEHPTYKVKTALRELARVLVRVNGEVNLTANQHVVLAGIPDTAKPEIVRLLAHYGVDNAKHSALRLHSMACVALPTCALAMAESQRYLPSLITKLESTLEECGLRQDAITMRMTGCPNGCGRPYLAEIALIGKAPGVYNLHLGGGFAGNRLNRIYREGVNEEQILDILRPLLRSYSRERQPKERFGDFCVRTKVIMPVFHGHSFWAKEEHENDVSSPSGTMQLYW